MKRLILSLLFFFSFLGEAHAKSVPDSLLTQDYIKNLTLSDPHQALRLLNEAEKRYLLPSHQIQFLRCLSYHNGLGEYRIALNYALKAYNSDSVKNDPAQALCLLNVIVDEYNSIGGYAESIRYANIGVRLAQKVGDKNMEANMLVYHGLTKWEMGMKIESEADFLRAADIQKKEIDRSPSWRNVDDLIYIYGTLISTYRDDGQYEKAIRLLPDYEEAMKRLMACPGLPERLYDMRYSVAYIVFAHIFVLNGEPEKGRLYYQKYLQTAYASDSEGETERIDYLLSVQHYGEALAYIDAEKQCIIKNEETASEDYIKSTLKNEALAYVGLGNYKAATAVYEHILALWTSLSLEEKRSMALELTTVYETSEKNQQIELQQSKLSQSRIVLISMAGVLFLLAVLSWQMVHNYRVIRQRNRIMVKQIEELINSRSELSKAKEEIRSLSVPLEKSDQDLFEQLDAQIVSERLFLDPNLSRDQLLKQIPVSKSIFMSFLQNCAYTNFNGYINNKRLEYSIRLLQDHSNYTIQAISIDSGFKNVRTFNRTFRDKYGMSPSEYRTTLSQF